MILFLGEEGLSSPPPPPLSLIFLPLSPSYPPLLYTLSQLTQLKKNKVIRVLINCVLSQSMCSSHNYRICIYTAQCLRKKVVIIHFVHISSVLLITGSTVYMYSRINLYLSCIYLASRLASWWYCNYPCLLLHAKLNSTC